MSSDTPQGIFNRKSAKTGSHIYMVKDHDGILRSCKTLDDAVMVLQGLKPEPPEVAQQIVLPCLSVIVTMVLLNEEWI